MKPKASRQSKAGKAPAQKFPPEWERHFRRMESLPKPRKQLSADEILALVGA